MSHRMSSRSSRPIESRTSSGVTPAASCSDAAELLMRGRGRVDHQAARIADVGQMREQLQAVDEAPARLVTALDAEGKHRARSRRRVLSGDRDNTDWTGRDAYLTQADQRVLFQMPGHRERV